MITGVRFWNEGLQEWRRDVAVWWSVFDVGDDDRLVYDGPDEDTARWIAANHPRPTQLVTYPIAR